MQPTPAQQQDKIIQILKKNEFDSCHLKSGQIIKITENANGISSSAYHTSPSGYTGITEQIEEYFRENEEIFKKIKQKQQLFFQFQKCITENEGEELGLKFAQFLLLNSKDYLFLQELSQTTPRESFAIAQEGDKTSHNARLTEEGEAFFDYVKSFTKINTIKPLERNVTINNFNKWEEDSHKKLEKYPSEANFKLYLNPKNEDGKNQYAGWGAKLTYENGDPEGTFTITEVIGGGFADVIGLKKVDSKIEIDLEHEDFVGKKGELLKAALIHKLRKKEFKGIQKIDDYDLDNVNHKNILEYYNPKVFIKKDDGSYKLDKGQKEVKEDPNFKEICRQIYRHTDKIEETIFLGSRTEKEDLIRSLLEPEVGDEEATELQKLINDILDKEGTPLSKKNTKTKKEEQPLIKNNGGGQKLQCGYYAMAAGILQLNESDKNRILDIIKFNGNLTHKITEDQYTVGNVLFEYVKKYKEQIFNSAIQKAINEFTSSAKKEGTDKRELEHQIRLLKSEVFSTDKNIYADRMGLICQHLKINLIINDMKLTHLDTSTPQIEILNTDGNHYEAIDIRSRHTSPSPSPTTPAAAPSAPDTPRAASPPSP